MAETSPKAPLVEEPDEPQPIIDADEREEDELQDESPDERYAREAMELAHIRSTYSRASRQVALSTASSKPSTFLGHLTYNLSKFWRHQISIVVPHSTCRDHLGTDILSSIEYSLYRATILDFLPGPSETCLPKAFVYTCHLLFEYRRFHYFKSCTMQLY